MSVYIYIYMRPEKRVCIYIYIYTHVHVHVHVYVCDALRCPGLHARYTDEFAISPEMAG